MSFDRLHKSRTLLSPVDLLEKIEEGLKPLANPENAVPMKKYMKDKFEFLGVKAPPRRALAKSLHKCFALADEAALMEFFHLCWQQPYREFQYMAMEIGEKYLKGLSPAFLPVIEELVQTKSWWDTVDWLAPKGAGSILLRHPEEIPNYPDKWNENDNFWLQRAAILFQLKYKDKTDFELLKKYILRRSDSKEFFVNKAAGWALREYAKRSPEKVRAFVKGHELPALTKREALKNL
jgi:3-methyladenine DNA glycosylase AlkD